MRMNGSQPVIVLGQTMGFAIAERESRNRRKKARGIEHGDSRRRPHPHLAGQRTQHRKLIALLLRRGDSVVRYAQSRTGGLLRKLASCHPADVDGYVIEGHIPESAIRRLLTERPKARGLRSCFCGSVCAGLDLRFSARGVAVRGRGSHLGWSGSLEMEEEGPAMNKESILTCPKCGHRTAEQMPTDACQFFYDCKGCGERLKPMAGDCCVFCSYGSVPCPPKQEGDNCCSS